MLCSTLLKRSTRRTCRQQIVSLALSENYYKVVQDTTNASILNRDFGNDANGSIASGQVVNIAGVVSGDQQHPRCCFGNLGTGDITTPAGDKSSLPDTQDYTGDGTAKVPEGIVSTVPLSEP